MDILQNYDYETHLKAQQFSGKSEIMQESDTLPQHFLLSRAGNSFFKQAMGGTTSQTTSHAKKTSLNESTAPTEIVPVTEDQKTIESVRFENQQLEDKLIDAKTKHAQLVMACEDAYEELESKNEIIRAQGGVIREKLGEITKLQNELDNFKKKVYQLASKCFSFTTR